MTLEQLEKKWADDLAHLEDMKQRGDLTKDWGECSLICTRRFLEDIRTVRAQSL